MATKRRTDHDSPREPRRNDGAGVRAAPAEPAGAGPADDAGRNEARNETKGEAVTDAGRRSDERPVAAAASPEADRRVEELASQLEEANGHRLRLAADFENYKKRVRQELLDTRRHAAAAVAERLLPVLDDAERALNHVPDGVDESWLKGVRLTFQKLNDVLTSVGVERIEALGARFDPKLHEAVGSEETAKHPEDTVVAELRPGYRMHDRVLRPALVRVARPPA
jgi:molecular chaperone GrpE